MCMAAADKVPLEYAGVRFCVGFAPHTREPIMSLLGDYLSEGDEAEPSLFSVVLSGDRCDDLARRVLECGRPICILNADQPALIETGHCLDSGSLRYVRNSMTNGVYRLDYRTRTIDVRNPDQQMLGQDGKRVIRDILRATVQDGCAGVMYHAAAVESPSGAVVMLIGSKGAGKTTLSLKLVCEHGFTEISRDKVFLQETGGELLVHGWPTHYNLTARSLKEFDITRKYLPPHLHGRGDSDLEGLKQKIQLGPESLPIERRAPRGLLTHVCFLLPDRAPFDVDEALAENCLSPHDPLYSDWHRWIRDYSTIEANAKSITSRLADFASRFVVRRASTIDDTVATFLRDLCQAGGS